MALSSFQEVKKHHRRFSVKSCQWHGWSGHFGSTRRLAGRHGAELASLPGGVGQIIAPGGFERIVRNHENATNWMVEVLGIGSIGR